MRRGYYLDLLQLKLLSVRDNSLELLPTKTLTVFDLTLQIMGLDNNMDHNL